MIRAVTTCNAKQWRQFGKVMARTFVEHWTPDICLTIYAEGFGADDALPEVEFLELDAATDWFPLWKKLYAEPRYRGMGGGSYSYRQDAVKFAHKIAALSAACEMPCDVLIWMDADAVTHSPVTADWLEGLLGAADMAWLDRDGRYPECGFMMWRMPAGRMIIKRIVKLYRSGAIFNMRETHDSYVIQQVVEAAAAKKQIHLASLSGDVGRRTTHPFVNGPLGSRMDHLKGDRKRQGRSPWRDLRVPRDEVYWLKQMRQVRFKVDAPRGNGEVYKAGEVYILRPDQARHWFDRGVVEKP